ncbi:hypothetical protein HO133_000396 [Letharia lupina]|uniref:Fun14 family protein n=1 Tax=Letharia lupina TaxID=560253 RepID=A0A8H6CHK7_9LECA|nr:uncharacterized protein HO133_000396 [Letharia lupina]KAF6223553.1 hypothetical protein HO133_000396 [Letharia lupina]
MASFLLPRSRPLFSLTLGLGLSSLYASQALYRQKPRLCEGPGATPLTTVSESFKAYSRDAKVPVFKDGRPNPRAYRQISAGSIVGLLGGVAVSTFSKTLAMLFGLLVFGVQYMASQGYNIIPTTKLQRYVKGIDLRSAVEDNVAFKLSFGLTFALASLASF